jgi:hypothetical protein
MSKSVAQLAYIGAASSWAICRKKLEEKQKIDEEIRQSDFEY